MEIPRQERRLFAVVSREKGEHHRIEKAERLKKNKLVVDGSHRSEGAKRLLAGSPSVETKDDHHHIVSWWADKKRGEKKESKRVG